MAKHRGRAAEGTIREDALAAPMLETLLRSAHKPLRIDDFLRVLALPRRRKKDLEACLLELVREGRAIRLSGGGYILTGALKQVTGVLGIQRSGVGFVRLDRPGKGEVFISRHHLGQAWNGDRVQVVLFPGRHGKHQDGRITQVLERAVTDVVVRVVRNGKDGLSLCAPVDTRIPALFQVDIRDLERCPATDSLLRIRVGDAVGPGLWSAVAPVLLGDEWDAAVQEALVKANHAVPQAFSAAVLEEVTALPRDPGPESFAGRKDMSHLPFVTIDGPTARDFDDAVCVEKNTDGYTLYVAIADVAHYVRPGSALDREASERGNTYYFPRSAEPMLPEALSNGLCSLKPGVPRLVMTAEIVFSDQGIPVKEVFYPAVSVSSARLTYDEVRDGLLGAVAEVRQRLAPHLPMLEHALALARILAQARRAKGSLDFDLPEPECVFDADGDLVSLVPRESHCIHTLIEMFMVAANEAVARFLTHRGIPMLYRTHPAPDADKLRALFQLLAAVRLLPPGLSRTSPRKTPPSPGQLQTVLDSARGTPFEYLVSRMALRAMMQAGYTPDEDGHFGLASDCYCHFTSPIRRYADLVTHRALKAALGCDAASHLPGRKRLQAIADRCNEAERTAMDAEREIYRRMGVLVMRDHVGEEYAGIISGVAEFGIFVEIGRTMTEGMVRLHDLDDDHYVHSSERHELRGERTGKIYRLGQTVTVVVTDVSLARLEIDLSLVSGARRRGGPGKRKKGRR